MAKVEAGAQGQHKIQRGYMPVHTYSAHWIENPSFHAAVERFLEEEARHVDWEVEAIEREYSPFRKSD